MAVVAHVGDVGLIIRVTLKDEAGTAVNVSAATTKQIKLATPSGTVSAKTAAWGSIGAMDGSDGIIEYATIAGDLTIRGTWRAQAYIITPTRTFHSSIHDFEVEDYLA